MSKQLPTQAIPQLNRSDELLEVLKPYIEKGLVVEFDETSWTVKHKGISESGNLGVKLDFVKRSAESIMKARKPARVEGMLSL